MGLFDKLLGSKESALTPQAGLLLAAIAMVSIDGDVDDNEFAVIRRLDGSGKTEAWDLAVRVWKAKSIEECVELAAGSMNGEQRLGAIANLIDISMADGALGGSEKRLLEAFVEAFQVDVEAVARIVEVISIKNNRSIFERSSN